MLFIKSHFLRKKIFLTTIGITLLFLLLTEFYFLSKQPVASLGMTLNVKNNNFVVTELSSDSPAWKAGIRENTLYKSINNLKIEDFITQKRTLSDFEFKQIYSEFYNFNQTFEFKDLDDNTYSFVLLQEPFSFCLKTTPNFILIKYIIAVAMLLCGLGIVLFCYNDKSISTLVYSVYFLAVTTANLFDSEFSSHVFSNITASILDFGLFLAFTCIFSYLSKIQKSIHKKNLFYYIKYFPLTFYIIKLAHILCFNWNHLDNPLQSFTAVIIVFCCLLFIAIFIHLVIAYPRNVTVVFRFFVLGLAFAVIPLLLQHFSFSISNSLFMSEVDKIYSTLSFIFLPFLLLLAILHNKNVIRSKSVFWITTYLAFLIICLPPLVITIEYFNEKAQHNFICLLFVLSPVIFIIIHSLIIKFFALNTNENSKKLDEYQRLISLITDTYELHQITTREIHKILDNSFAFYYKKNNGIWDLLYEWGDITKEKREYKMQESCTKKRVTFYKDGSFSIPIVRNDETTGVIYIGPKSNGDLYLPGEHILIEQMIRAFHNHYLMYTNTYLLNALNSKNEAIVHMQENTILSMANLIESRDGGTGAHVRRTAEYSVLIAKKAKEKLLFTEEINDNFITLLYKAAPMHDIGKIVVPDHILKKPGRFSPEEFDLMKLHTTEGERIVKEVLSASEDPEYIMITSKIAMYHHEKWDGSGYPKGLKETEIPLCARILAIADVFDALVSPRCYKEPMDPEKAFGIIKQDAGSHFDPVLAEVFLELKEEALVIMKKFI